MNSTNDAGTAGAAVPAVPATAPIVDVTTGDVPAVSSYPAATVLPGQVMLPPTEHLTLPGVEAAIAVRGAMSSMTTSSTSTTSASTTTTWWTSSTPYDVTSTPIPATPTPSTGSGSGSGTPSTGSGLGTPKAVRAMMAAIALLLGLGVVAMIYGHLTLDEVARLLELVVGLVLKIFGVKA